jgi:SAM-dependent methyltransferase
MSKQAEREFALRVADSALYGKPFWNPRALREFGIVLELLRQCVPTHGAVLDLGCGPGWTSLFLARAGYDVVGVDISERMIEVARDRSRRESAPAAFVAADMEELALDRRDFDGVLLFDALHHCPGYRQVLRRAWEHLRPGGSLLLLEPSWLHQYSPHARAFSKQYGVTELGFSRWHLSRELRRAGFTRVSHWYDPGSAYRGLFGLVLASLRVACGFLSCYPQIKQIIVARK